MKRDISKFAALFVLFALVAMSGCGGGVPAWEGGERPEEEPQFVEGGVQFSIIETDAKTVHIVGDFNNWSKISDLLYDREGKGLWQITIPLKPGRYEYKFLIDGKKWIPDEGNAERIPDGFGGWNSVITVK
jgi:1,4-alpha-glucan branching enzyme